MPRSLSPLALRDAATAAALALLVLLTGSLRMAPGTCGSFHDDAIYVSTAEALASGQGYRLIDVPGAPRQTKYPILYPAILAVVWYVCPSFPDNILVMQAVTLAFAAAAIALGYLYVVRFGYASRGVALAAALICATAPYYLYFAVQTMAEMPFALLSIVALWGLERAVAGPEMSRRSQFGWGVALALPFLCRSIGATLVAAGLWVLLRQRRPLRWYAAGAASAAAPWILWSLLGRGIWNHDPVDGYYTDYLGCWSSTGLSLAGRVFCRNLLMTAHGTAELPFEGISTALLPWLGTQTLVLAGMIVGLLAWLSIVPDLRRNQPLAWMLVAYLAAMLVWSWPPYRFLVPIMPFLVVYLLRVPTALAKFPATAIGPRLAAAACLAVVVLANGDLLARHAVDVRRTGFPLARLTDDPISWSSYERTFDWLREHTRPDDVLAAGLDSMVALYSDRPAFRPYVYDPGRLFYGDEQLDPVSPDELATILKRCRPRYFVASPMPGFMEEQPLERSIEALRTRYPQWLTVAYQDANPRFTVFALDPSHEPRASETRTSAREAE